jgi:hypothetical protein
MPKFSKRPVVIEAIQWTGDNLREVLGFTGRHERFSEWFKDWKAYERHVKENGDTFKIFTLEGAMIASPGDWIIRGIKGEYYPCKPDIFTATYAPVGGLSDGLPQPSTPDPRAIARAAWICGRDAALSAYDKVLYGPTKDGAQTRHFRRTLLPTTATLDQIIAEGGRKDG